VTALAASGLGAGYGPLKVLHGVEFDVGAGQVTTVIGPNGAGKSTLMATLAGTCRAWEGSVTLGGTDVTRVSSARRMRCGLGWVPEGRNVFRHLPVRDNLYLSCFMAGLKREYDELEAQVFEEFPVLSRKYRSPAGALSGGEQQILALARALIRRPKVTLLDEPTVGLAPPVVEVLRAAVALRADQGMAWVITEQNTGWLQEISTGVLVMLGGRIVGRGPGPLLRDRGALKDMYFGAARPPGGAT
jgi:ABC-type branched-subunit amino acid transport system ATPase component